jgi:hypothetical protein
MTKQEWIRIKPTLKEDEYYCVEWRCNWHRGHGWKKPNKTFHFRIFSVGENYIQFVDRDSRMNYKAIVKIEKIIVSKGIR